VWEASPFYGEEDVTSIISVGVGRLEPNSVMRFYQRCTSVEEMVKYDLLTMFHLKISEIGRMQGKIRVWWDQRTQVSCELVHNSCTVNMIV